MKKSIIALVLTIATTPCFAATTMECTAKSLKVRQLPEEGSPMVGGIMHGERVTFIEKRGNWSKVQLAKGKEGYAFSAYLKIVDDAAPVKNEAKTESPKLEAPMPAGAVVIKHVDSVVTVEEERSILDSTLAAKPAPVQQMMVPVNPVPGEIAKSAVIEKKAEVKPVVEVKPAEAAQPVKLRTISLASEQDKEELIAALKTTNDILLKELIAMKQERAEMAALKKEISENIRCVVKEREENEKRVQHAENMQKKAETEVAEIKSSLVLGGNARLLTLADNGEKAYFKGVGEVNLAFEGGRTVLRVEEFAMTKTERALTNSNPEKFLRNGFAYFVVDSKSLAF